MQGRGSNHEKVGGVGWGRKEKSKVKEARDVRLIIAWIYFLQKNITRENLGDFQSYFFIVKE